ncbi:MAG: DUF6328 family protein [Actinomycetota bacterium]|nr:DUF6328 family protein [Actinomycetota bacterium]
MVDTSRSGEKGRRDRELMELLNELRVALPGVQVLFAFLLTVPFTQRFPDITDLQRNVYFGAFLTAAAATAFLIAPTAYHRLRFREGDEERMLQTANVLAIIGTVFLALSVVCVVFLITDLLFGGFVPALVTAVAAGLFAGLWYGLPLFRHIRDS